MKTVITSTGDQISSPFDKRFGRAAWFCVYDQETAQVSFLKNMNAEAQNGAGTKTTEKIIELEAGKVISGDFGPKAKDLLERFNIQMVIMQEDDLTIENIIQKLNH